MQIEDIKELIYTLDKTNIENIEIQDKDFKITINKKSGDKVKESTPITDIKTEETEKVIEEIETPEIKPSLDEDESLYTIKSPMVGVFYNANSPEDEPFVKVGDSIKKGQKICILEAMKIMNEIESDCNGEIVEILVDNESIVEYEEPLMKIRRID